MYAVWGPLEVIWGNYGKFLLRGMFWNLPPPGWEDFCHVGAATKPKSQQSKSQECSKWTVWVYEPLIWPQEFFLQFYQNMFRDPKWHSLGRIFICPCANVVLWRCVGIRGIYWASCGYGLDMMSPAFHFFLRGRNSATNNFPKSPPMAPKLHTDTHKWQLQ